MPLRNRTEHNTREYKCMGSFKSPKRRSRDWAYSLTSLSARYLKTTREIYIYIYLSIKLKKSWCEHKTCTSLYLTHLASISQTPALSEEVTTGDHGPGDTTLGVVWLLDVGPQIESEDNCRFCGLSDGFFVFSVLFTVSTNSGDDWEVGVCDWDDPGEVCEWGWGCWSWDACSCCKYWKKLHLVPYCCLWISIENWCKKTWVFDVQY